MTKKHFEAFANFIAFYGSAVKPSDANAIATRYAREDMARMVCKVASADNPRFDSARFLQACGLES